MPKNSTLEITGSGELKTQPDQTVLYIQVFAENSEAGRASEQVNERVNSLVKKLHEAGFKKSEISISQFYLNENNRWRNGEMVRNGYRASQQLEVTFANNTSRLDKASKVMETYSEGLTFSFSFILSDAKQKEVREEVIRKSIQDAREKAAVIARSAGIQLGTIYRIVYGESGRGSFPSYNQNMREANMMKSSDASFPPVEVTDVTIQDSVLIIWTIE